MKQTKSMIFALEFRKKPNLFGKYPPPLLPTRFFQGSIVRFDRKQWNS